MSSFHHEVTWTLALVSPELAGGVTREVLVSLVYWERHRHLTVNALNSLAKSKVFCGSSWGLKCKRLRQGSSRDSVVIEVV